jgi:hypothetical protein
MSYYLLILREHNLHKKYFSFKALENISKYNLYKKLSNSLTRKIYLPKSQNRFFYGVTPPRRDTPLSLSLKLGFFYGVTYHDGGMPRGITAPCSYMAKGYSI